jgi:hypothetical protein
MQHLCRSTRLTAATEYKSGNQNSIAIVFCAQNAKPLARLHVFLHTRAFVRQFQKILYLKFFLYSTFYVNYSSIRINTTQSVYVTISMPINA